MKNAIIALGLTLASSTAAFAGGSALDAVLLPQDTSAHNAMAVASNSAVTNDQTSFDRLGDGSPMFTGSIDYTTTASISSSYEADTNASLRLGDGVLPY